MDHYWDKWRPLPLPTPPQPVIIPNYPYQYQQPPTPMEPLISQAEIEEFRKLLERARLYDKEHNQPECELAEKKERIKKLAKELGVDLVFLETDK